MNLFLSHPRQANIPSIVLLTYANGCSLAVDVLQRQLVRCATTPNEQLRIRAIAAIEPSQACLL